MFAFVFEELWTPSAACLPFMLEMTRTKLVNYDLWEGSRSELILRFKQTCKHSVSWRFETKPLQKCWPVSAADPCFVSRF